MIVLYKNVLRLSEQNYFFIFFKRNILIPAPPAKSVDVFQNVLYTWSLPSIQSLITAAATAAAATTESHAKRLTHRRLVFYYYYFFRQNIRAI